jgi:hypothetical protein
MKLRHVSAAKLSVVAALSFITVTAVAQTQASQGNNIPAVQVNKPEMPLPFIAQIKKAIVFINSPYRRKTATTSNSGETIFKDSALSTEGTGFLIRIPVPSINSDAVETFLVTNRHMIREPGPDNSIGQGPYVRYLELRFNTKEATPDGNKSEALLIPVMDDSGQMGCFVNDRDLTLIWLYARFR